MTIKQLLMLIMTSMLTVIFIWATYNLSYLSSIAFKNVSNAVLSIIIFVACFFFMFIQFLFVITEDNFDKKIDLKNIKDVFKTKKEIDVEKQLQKIFTRVSINESDDNSKILEKLEVIKFHINNISNKQNKC